MICIDTWLGEGNKWDVITMNFGAHTRARRLSRQVLVSAAAARAPRTAMRRSPPRCEHESTARHCMGGLTAQVGISEFSKRKTWYEHTRKFVALSQRHKLARVRTSFAVGTRKSQPERLALK